MGHSQPCRVAGEGRHYRELRTRIDIKADHELWIDFLVDFSLLHPGKAVTLLSEFLERIYPIGG